jgi:hypothetical protein
LGRLLCWGCKVALFKNKISLLYLPLGLGAVIFAAFGINYIVQSAIDQGASIDNGATDQNEWRLQPSGSDCDTQYCASCGACSKGQFDLLVTKEVSASVNLSENFLK